MKYWLMKSEPSVFSIDDLARVKESTWDGVRNYQARNFMTKEMQKGDAVLFYHSSCEIPGVAGLATVSSEAVPDPSAQDKRSEYFEPKATPDNPIWFCVKIKFAKKFTNVVPLEKIKTQKSLSKMLLLKRGQRLSIQPVTKAEFETIRKMGEA